MKTKDHFNLFELICASSCSAEETPSVSPIPDIIIHNFPIIDGPDSTDSLRIILICKIHGIDYSCIGRPFTQKTEADIKKMIH